MTRVLVLAGGTSDEREVSVRSGNAVLRALEDAGYRATLHDPATGLETSMLDGIDVVFPVLHGKGGEDGELQAWLDRQAIPYVGTGTKASELCFDKWAYKLLLVKNMIPVPAGELVDNTTFWETEFIGAPFVVKPIDGGSSVDTIIVRDLNQQMPTQEEMAELFEKYPKLLIEELISGTELTVAVLGGQALPVIEIIPPEYGEFDYNNKYNGLTQELCPPRHVDQAIQTAAQRVAAEVHTLCGCRDFSRTDIIFGDNGELNVLETNTIPGMTDQSLFPKAAATAGIRMPELVRELVEAALTRSAT